MTDVFSQASLPDRPERAAARFRFRLSLPGWVYGFILPVALSLVWELAVRAGVVQAWLMPPPSRVAETLLNLARTGELLIHIAATLSRVGLGLALGASAGTLVGAVCGASLSIRRLLDPMIQALRAIP